MNLFKLFTVAVLLTVTNIAKSQCVSPTFDNYTYNVVEIGNQCWFAENLRTVIYSNGDTIPTNLSESDWTTTFVGASSIYGQGFISCTSASGSPPINACNETSSLSVYGRLYNWYSIEDNRGLCPNGWHVPSDEDFMTLEMTLGMSEFEANSVGSLRGTDEGTKLKSTIYWAGNDGTDDYGFTAYPAGLRNIYEADLQYPPNWIFDGSGVIGTFWSSSYGPIEGAGAWNRTVGVSTTVSRDAVNENLGYSVRCIQSPSIPSVLGCTGVMACNYDPAADENDGSCEYPQYGYDCECNQICWGDFTGDGFRTVDDLLLFLSAYGQTCQQLGLSD